MERQEARLDGGTEHGSTYTDFDEFDELEILLKSFGWEPEPFAPIGRGGYYPIKINVKGRIIKLHIYLKKLTFGGRENRPFEKRAQFSAALDRTGFDIEETENEFKLILAIYKRQPEIFIDSIICAWNINDWGYNIGRAFNCFTDVRDVAKAFKNGFSQHKTSADQVACCFRPENFMFYLDNKEFLHEHVLIEEEINQDIFGKKLTETDNSNLYSRDELDIPKFENLFQLIIDILIAFNGTASSVEIESKAVELLNLTEKARIAIHNFNEGYRTELGYRLAWARYYLKRAGFIINLQRSVWAITDFGRKTIIDKEKIIKIATKREIEIDFFKDIETEEDNSDIELDQNKDLSVIGNPFDPNKVDIKTKTMSLDLLLKRLDRGQIDMETNFQRKSGLWDDSKQSRLIESILIKFPLPAFYFDGSNDDKWLVVDGLQRLSSLDNFVNKKTLKLTNLEFLNQFNGKSFTELPGNLQRRIEEFEITAYIIAPGTPKELKYNVFKRINTGGLILTSQEIRNAIYNGQPAEFVKRLADFRSFKEATCFSIPEDRMLDREFATRFFTFYIFSPEEFNGDIESFLNIGLEKIYSLSKIELDEIAMRFDRAMSTATAIFEYDAFRKRYDKDDRRKPINKTLFEAWSVLLSRLSISETELLIKNSDFVKTKFIELLNNDEEFNSAISYGTGDKTRVKKRFIELSKIIEASIKV